MTFLSQKREVKLNKNNVRQWADAILGETSVQAPQTLDEAEPLAPVDAATTRKAHPSETETNAQIARRLELKRGVRVRMPDDDDGQPVRKIIKSIDGNGMVTFQGSRMQFPARSFLPR